MDYIIFLDIIGIITFSLSGYILAAKDNLDILGISLVSLITAFGGGVIRDLLVGVTPLIFTETYPITILLVVLIFAFMFKLHNHTHLTNNNLFIISDSIGLAVFSVAGAMIAIGAAFNFVGIILMALLTAIGGGVMRDIILNKVPYVFKSDFYGTVAILIGVFIWAIHTFYILDPFAVNVVLIFGFVIRIYAVKSNWSLPKLQHK